jgi:membrane-bound ClpP family serine protease
MTDSDPEARAREQIAETEAAEARDRASGMASLFDLRMVIGGLLALYGVILTVMGVFASSDTKAKAAGININLWAGLVILAGGAVFLAWARLRPLRAEDLQQADTDRPNVE